MRFLSIIFLLLAVAAANAGDPTVVPLPAMDRLFQRQSGWTGADGAYSVKLTDGRIAWLFSDTWVGRIENGAHRDSVIIDNSVAIRSDPNTIDFSYRHSPDGRPEALFNESGATFWPYDGIALGKSLYIFLQRVEKSGDAGFRHLGTSLAAVSNPTADPTAWKFTLTELPFGRFDASGDTLFGSSILRSGGFLYVFGTTESIKNGFHHKRLIAARVREKRLADFKSWRFFDGRRWRRDWRRAAPLADRFANEFTISFQPKLGKFVAVHTPDGISPEIAIRTAPAPVGPWSPLQIVYRCPESARDPNVICYAAKGHPSFSEDGDLIVSYVPSSTDFWQIATDSTLYVPKFVRLSW